MSLRFEQYNALKRTREFLRELLGGPRMPMRVLRKWAGDCLHHFPFLHENGQPMWSQDEFTKDAEEPGYQHGATYSILDIDLIEEVIMNPDALPEEMREGWGMYRIEYGGHAESCIWEGRVMLPRGETDGFVQLLMGMQVEAQRWTVIGGEDDE